MTNAPNIMTNAPNIMTNAPNIMTKAPNTMTKAPNIMTNASNIMTTDHLRQLWRSIDFHLPNFKHIFDQLDATNFNQWQNLTF